MNKSEQAEARTLVVHIERLIDEGAASETLLPLLERLTGLTELGSPERLYAERRLAELLIEDKPWKAALFARRLIANDASNDAHWALLGLAMSVMGHYKSAVAAYRQALACAPGNPWYAHNLGHLLDVALDSPDQALRFLRPALAQQPHDEAIGTSYAHALFRTGAFEEAARVIKPWLSAKRSPSSLGKETRLLWASIQKALPQPLDTPPASSPSPKPRRMSHPFQLEASKDPSSRNHASRVIMSRMRSLASLTEHCLHILGHKRNVLGRLRGWLRQQILHDEKLLSLLLDGFSPNGTHRSHKAWLGALLLGWVSQHPQATSPATASPMDSTSQAAALLSETLQIGVKSLLSKHRRLQPCLHTEHTRARA